MHNLREFAHAFLDDGKIRTREILVATRNLFSREKDAASFSLPSLNSNKIAKWVMGSGAGEQLDDMEEDVRRSCCMMGLEKSSFK